MGGLTHEGLIYDSADDFAANAVPWVQEGLAAGDPILVGVSRHALEALRTELGADADRVELRDTREWTPQPYERLQDVRRRLGELEPGRTLRAIGEPIWDGSDATRREWARYESLINLVLADEPMVFLCAYDREALTGEALAYGCYTHPEIREGGSSFSSPDYRPPRDFVPTLKPGEDRGPSGDAAEFEFGEDLHIFRGFVAARAAAAGLDPLRTEQVVFSASEMAANAVRHARPPFRVNAWRDGEEFVVSVTDRGTGLDPLLAGWTPPDPAARGGWGLPLARRLSDSLDIYRSGSANTVVLSVSVGSDVGEPAGS